MSCLSVHEASIMREGITLSENKASSFELCLERELASILGLYGCCAVPKPASLEQPVLNAARYTFMVRPAAPIAKMHSGIPKEHQAFWAGMGIRRLHTIYSTLTVSAVKVLQLLTEPAIANAGEECAWLFLKRFVGNMTTVELRSFLRFVTGSVVITVSSITVTFNKLSGLGRRPIGHTCGCSLEIPSTCASLTEFASEFGAVLSDPSYAWTMDAI